MSGFANQIIGGLSKLVRPAIQSPNFQTNVQGWTINADGSAEFNDAIFRGTVVISASGQALLVYDGTPAAGNLILAVASESGTDDFGNPYEAGLTLDGFVQGAATQGGLYFEDNLATTATVAQLVDMITGGFPNLILQGPFPVGGNTFPQLWLYYDNAKETHAKLNADAVDIEATHDATIGALTLRSGLGGILERFKTNYRLALDSAPNDPIIQANSDATLAFGAGPNGRYYFEQVDLASQAVASGANVTLLGFTADQLESNYGSAFNLATGVWTCPESGSYDFTLFVQYSTAFVSGSRFFIGARRLSATGSPYFLRFDGTATVGGVGVGESVSVKRWFSKGDTVDFHAVQSTGVAQTVDNTSSYITVRRDL